MITLELDGTDRTSVEICSTRVANNDAKETQRQDFLAP